MTRRQATESILLRLAALVLWGLFIVGVYTWVRS